MPATDHVNRFAIRKPQNQTAFSSSCVLVFFKYLTGQQRITDLSDVNAFIGGFLIGVRAENEFAISHVSLNCFDVHVACSTENFRCAVRFNRKYTIFLVGWKASEQVIATRERHGQTQIMYSYFHIRPSKSASNYIPRSRISRSRASISGSSAISASLFIVGCGS